MTGHFILIGTPEELMFKTYGQENEKELAEWKFGKYQRFKTFSATVIASLRAATDKVMIAGEVREKQGKGDYSDRIFDVWQVTDCTHVKSKTSNQNAPKSEPENDLPF